MPEIFINYDKIATQRRIAISMDMIEVSWKERKIGDRWAKRCCAKCYGENKLEDRRMSHMYSFC